LAANSFSISPKSSVAQSVPAIDGLFCFLDLLRAMMISYGLDGGVTATANNIRDGGARYVATSFNISADKSLIQTTVRAEVWAATLLRLQLGSSCPSGADAIVAVIAGALLTT
jgi:hypothetical protein